MEQCFRCEKSEREVRLSDAIYENDLVKVCERCAVTENIPVLRRPSTSQLKAAERSEGVYQRLKRISGRDEKERSHKSILDEIKKLDEHPELEKPDKNKPFNLIDNFHWHVTRARRNRGLSQKQLAWALGESETAVKIMERGELPEEPEKLIRKMEQFFQIHLIERSPEEIERERIKREEKNKPEVEIEPIQAISQEEIEEEDLVQGSRVDIGEDKEKRPAQVLKFKPELMDNITIADLKKIKEEKEEEEKEEQETMLELRKREMRERVGQEMKNQALGGQKESISEKREMLNKAMTKAGEEESSVPTIHELMERKKNKEKSKIEEEKMEVKRLEKKTEQEQIKEILKGNQIQDIKPTEENKEEPEKKPAPTISELKEKKKADKEESLLGDDIEIIEE
jgi:ribosome-binding protein aMBF1 (putative translation factor)